VLVGNAVAELKHVYVFNLLAMQLRSQAIEAAPLLRSLRRPLRISQLYVPKLRLCD
jgi:hypothetical protein